MAVLLTAVLPFSNLWAEDKTSQNLGAEHRFSEMQNAYRSSNFELYFVKQSMATAEPISFSHETLVRSDYTDVIPHGKAQFMPVVLNDYFFIGIGNLTFIPCRNSRRIDG